MILFCRKLGFFYQVVIFRCSFQRVLFFFVYWNFLRSFKKCGCLVFFLVFNLVGLEQWLGIWSFKNFLGDVNMQLGVEVWVLGGDVGGERSCYFVFFLCMRKKQGEEGFLVESFLLMWGIFLVVVLFQCRRVLFSIGFFLDFWILEIFVFFIFYNYQDLERGYFKRKQGNGYIDFLEVFFLIENVWFLDYQ